MTTPKLDIANNKTFNINYYLMLAIPRQTKKNNFYNKKQNIYNIYQNINYKNKKFKLKDLEVKLIFDDLDIFINKHLFDVLPSEEMFVSVPYTNNNIFVSGVFKIDVPEEEKTEVKEVYERTKKIFNNHSEFIVFLSDLEREKYNILKLQTTEHLESGTCYEMETIKGDYICRYPKDINKRYINYFDIIIIENIKNIRLCYERSSNT